MPRQLTLGLTYHPKIDPSPEVKFWQLGPDPKSGPAKNEKFGLRGSFDFPLISLLCL